MTNAIAHTKQSPSGEWLDPHPLDVHLREVGRIAGEFACAFGNEDWGQVAGLWHDLGKYKAAFQDYIRTQSGFERDEAQESGPGKVDHTTAGAIHAVDQLGPHGRILAYLIAGHHAGLPDWDKESSSGRSLSVRLADRRHLNEALSGGPSKEILEQKRPTSLPPGKSFNPSQSHLWLRMLFSCLVDADFLDTEAYIDPVRSAHRGVPTSLSRLREHFDRFMERKQEAAPDTPVNRLRRQILADCRAGANLLPGLFSLTVPTGGGKTLASMGFALDHAALHGKRRIIVAIPYTSIIEQTAQELRKVFGDDAVLEHHSNLDPDRETQASKLATENWDAPIVVTTNVQLFESLFAARTSACRKLHNLANSVIILDETQMLPPEFLRPILSVLEGLASHFGVTTVLCTATQPSLEGVIGAEKAKFQGLTGVRELMRDRDALAGEFRRVSVRIKGTIDQPNAWTDVAADLLQHTQVLCIVNTRRDCRELHRLLPEGTIHLSALMCGEHRSLVISEIKRMLRAGMPTRVVSTQLVEAGVDLDFPVVYRALAGLDSIAQAAGRCNREGLLQGRLGQVVVFAPPKPAPRGLLRKGEDAAREMFRTAPDATDLLPSTFQSYFKKYFGKVNSFDEKDIMGYLAGPDARSFQIQFRMAADRFRLIDDEAQKSIIVWYKTGKFDSQKLLEELKQYGPNRHLMRRLQRCSVSVPEAVWNSLQVQAAIEEIKGPYGSLGIWAQCVPTLYDETFGLRVEGPAFKGDEFIC